MKKHILFFVSIIITLSTLMIHTTLPAGAEKTDAIIILGDSISTGYGLSGELYERPSFANKIHAHIGNGSLLNIARDGATSSEILQIATNSSDTIKEMDIVIMSVGGNDLLQTTAKVISESLGTPDNNDLASLLGTVMNMPADQIKELFSSDYSNACYSEMLDGLSKNLDSILSLIRTTAPNAKIVVLNQYNPFSGLNTSEAALAFDLISSQIINQINDLIINTVIKYNADICDTYGLFDGQGALYTRIMSMDIHPNEAGHAMIYDMLTLVLDLNSPDAPETFDPIGLCVVGLLGSSICIILLHYGKRKIKSK